MKTYNNFSDVEDQDQIQRIFMLEYKILKEFKKMKKILTLILTLTMLFAIASPVFAEDNADTVIYVSIANGDIILAYEPITVTDADGDGTLTVNDALICAHNEKYEGGADAGYSSAETDYGLSLYKLWGVENGGSYGYCVNNVSSMSLRDPVANGNHVYAYVYTDLTYYSDTYSYFNAEVTEDGVSLTLLYNGYDENWAPVTNALANAVITLDGVKTEYVTDENGKVLVPTDALSTGKTVVISAVSDSMTLVPPVHTVLIEAETETEAPQTGMNTVFFALAAVLSLGVAVKAKHSYEK